MPSKKKTDTPAEMPSLKDLAASGAKSASTFEELLSAATAMAKDDAPKAAFYEADGPCPKGAKRFADIPDWRFVYADMAGGTIFVTASGGKITGESHVDQPWLEDRVIAGDQPVTFDMAVGILNHAGYTQPFTYVNLRFPLYPGVVEPAYIFQFGRGSFVSVGARTGAVHGMSVSGVAQRVPPKPSGVPAKVPSAKPGAGKPASKKKAKAA